MPVCRGTVGRAVTSEISDPGWNPAIIIFFINNNSSNLIANIIKESELNMCVSDLLKHVVSLTKAVGSSFTLIIQKISSSGTDAAKLFGQNFLANI